MSTLRFFLDEDLPRKAEKLLLSMRHDVSYVPTAGVKGLKNRELLARASREQRILVTQDKGFLKKRRYASSGTTASS